jgi:hypothetical protein
VETKPSEPFLFRDPFLTRSGLASSSVWMSEDVCGDWALNHRGQLVAAWDKKRAMKGATHEYFCMCKCGDTVTLRQGDILRPHFAYKAHRRNGCTGTTGCKETEVHYNAKWLLRDIFPQINFWRVCGYNHRITKKQYTGPEWTATVEKQIPGTTRIADVLLENSSTKEAVALEVYHTHAVAEDKKTECELAGVTIIEVEATHVVHGVEVLAITPGCRDLDNELNQYEHDECGECVEEDLLRQARVKAYRARKEKEEHDRRAREELEREQLREQNIAMELQNAAREAEQKREEIERQEREESERRAVEETRRRERDTKRKMAEAHAHAKAEQEIVRAAATRKRRRAEMAAAIATSDRAAMWAMGALRGPIEF